MKNFLIGLSIDVPSNPYVEFSLGSQVLQDGRKVSGSGLSWYPNNDNSAIVVKDPNSFAELGRPHIIDDKKIFDSSNFMFHLNGAAWNPSSRDTEPYSKPLAKKDWVWMHQGNLDVSRLRKLNKQLGDTFFEPVGTTDSEMAFCIFLNRIARMKARSMKEVGWDKIHDWFKELDEYGTANFFVSDGNHMVVYRGLDGDNAIYKQRIKPPYETLLLKNDEAGFLFDFRNEDDYLKTLTIFSTLPVTFGGYREMKKGQMCVVKKSKIVWNSHAEGKKTLFSDDQIQQPVLPNAPIIEEPSRIDMVNTNTGIYINMNLNRDSRIMKVTHETHYTYDSPVEKSENILRLLPQYSRTQQVLEYGLNISVPNRRIMYRDVFQNDVVQMIIEQPYTDLVIKSEAIVKIHKPEFDDFTHPLRKLTVPLTWMPWQRQMMQAYLVPPELPETQLRELSDYANSFMDRNDGYVFDAFTDINRTIFEDYKYESGSTDFNTSAFDVYVQRHGVCQDFANLLICMARLLNIPARYRMGYIYTGANYDNKVQGDATHAWAELYIPYLGWRGFDPTNGKLVDLDYVRVACGRNYIDATPTAGTLFKGGAGEKLNVIVKTEVVG